MPNVLLAPGTVNIEITLDPVYNNLSSLGMLNLAETYSGVDEWVKQTAVSLPVEQMRTHRLLFGILYSAFEPDEDWPSFPVYLDNLASQNPVFMRNRFLNYMFACSGEQYTHHNQLMDLETFITQIDRSEMDLEIERDLFTEAHALLSDPPAMLDTIVAHLTTMWQKALAAEWERNEAFLARVVEAFQSHDYSGLGTYEAIQTITGRSAHGNWQKTLASAETLRFIPSAHIGPYLTQYAYLPLVRIIFGARLPEEVEISPPELTHTDLLVRLRTLADETRLHILELLLEEGELCAQEIITRLNLTKSSASRHLSQLSAAGYLVEHQKAGKTKCYTLNPEYFRETLRFLERYTKV
jgi:DNA-binding transcriptional ArsR family regulator